MYTHSRQTKGGGLERGYAFFSLCQRQLCAAVGFPAHCKENISEQPLNELPQKVGECVFFAIVILSLCVFDPRLFSSLFFSLALLSHPCAPPAPSVLSAFHSGITMGSPLEWGGVLAVALAVRAHVMSSQRGHPQKAGIECPHRTLKLTVSYTMLKLSSYRLLNHHDEHLCYNSFV